MGGETIVVQQGAREREAIQGQLQETQSQQEVSDKAIDW